MSQTVDFLKLNINKTHNIIIEYQDSMFYAAIPVYRTRSYACKEYLDHYFVKMFNFLLVFPI